MRNNMTTINPYENKFKIDLRSDSLKAYDYVNFLASEAGVENERFVQNLLNVIRAFSHNPMLVNQQVKLAEQKLKGLAEQRRRKQGSGNLPGLNVFRNGVIDLGTVVGNNIDALLKIESLSGNIGIWGGYGMGKSNVELNIIMQLIREGIHVNIFDVTIDYRSLLLVPKCSNGLVISPKNERLNPLEPIGDPEAHLQFLMEITQQDFNLRPESKELLYNYIEELYRIFDVYNGANPPTLIHLNEFLKEQKLKPSTTLADKRKLDTVLRKLSYILYSFSNMVNCSRSFPLETIDRFDWISYEIGELSQDKRSWYMKLKLKQYQHQGTVSKQRHGVKRIISIDESKNIFGKSRIGEASYLKDMFTRSRSLGIWWIINDQFTSELADFTKAAALQISFQHTVPKELRNIAAAMGTENLKFKIPTIGRYRAFVKMTDFPHPFLIMTRKSEVEKHITDSELKELMEPKLSQLNRTIEKSQTNKRAELTISNINTSPETEPIKSKHTVPEINIETKNPLKELEDFLGYIKNNQRTKITDIYKALNFSGRRGNNIKAKAKDNQLIKESIHKTGRKGRSRIELELTQTGKDYISEKQWS